MLRNLFLMKLLLHATCVTESVRFRALLLTLSLHELTLAVSPAGGYHAAFTRPRQRPPLLAPALHWNQPAAHLSRLFLLLFIWQWTVNVITAASHANANRILVGSGIDILNKCVNLKHFAASASRFFFFFSLTFSAPPFCFLGPSSICIG